MYVRPAPQFIACISFQRVDNDRSKTFKHGITGAGGRYYNIMNSSLRGVGSRSASRSSFFCAFFVQPTVLELPITEKDLKFTTQSSNRMNLFVLIENVYSCCPMK